jgi:hypothetical protein
VVRRLNTLHAVNDILLLVQTEFLVPLFIVLNLRRRSVRLVSFLLATLVDLFLLLRTQRVVSFPGDLELEVDGNMGGRTGRIDRVGGRVVLIRRQMRFLLVVPPSDDEIAETGIPVVRAISLDGGKHPPVGLTEP